MFVRVCLSVVALALAGSVSVRAQEPQAPAPTGTTPSTPGTAPTQVLTAPSPWHATLGAGLAITSGNSDTSTFNASYAISHDPKARNTFKSDGSYIRGTSSGESSADRLGINVRDQFQCKTGLFVFGQTQYLHDEFKDIQYLVAPTTGLGYNFIDTPQTAIALDLGVGGVWEKNPGADVKSSGAITLNQRLSQTVTSSTTLTQSLAALWPTTDFGDSLWTQTAGMTAAMSSRTQLKVEALDTFKNKPPQGIAKNDVSLFVALVFKS
jgi:putative salt-induced outer membrane protein YdiY